MSSLNGSLCRQPARSCHGADILRVPRKIYAQRPREFPYISRTLSLCRDHVRSLGGSRTRRFGEESQTESLDRDLASLCAKDLRVPLVASVSKSIEAASPKLLTTSYRHIPLRR